MSFWVIAPITWTTGALVRSFGVPAYTFARILCWIRTFIYVAAAVDKVGVALVAFGAPAVVTRPIGGVDTVTVIADTVT